MGVEIRPVGPQGKKDYRVKISAELYQQIHDAQEALKQRGMSANINDELVKALERSVSDINRFLGKNAPAGSAAQGQDGDMMGGSSKPGEQQHTPSGSAATSA